MPSPADDYDRRHHHRSSPDSREPRTSRYSDDADNEDHIPSRRSSRREPRKYYDDDLADRGPPSSKSMDAPVVHDDPRDVEANMKAPRRDRYPADDPAGVDVSRKDDNRDDLRRNRRSKRYSDDEGDKYARRSGRPRSYTDDEDGGYRATAPRRSHAVRDSGRHDRDRRRGSDDRYESSYDELPRPPRRTTTKDFDDRGYKSDGRDGRRRRDRYDELSDEHDRGYRSGGGRHRRDPYDDRDRDYYRRSDRDRDRDRDRERDRDRDRDRDRGYRSDDHHYSRRGYESDRGAYRSDRDRDRYHDRRDRRGSGDRYDDRDRDSRKKKGGSLLDPKNIPKYIEQGQKHYHTVQPLVKGLMDLYVKNK